MMWVLCIIERDKGYCIDQFSNLDLNKIRILGYYGLL